MRAEPFAPEELSQDVILGGRVTLAQPREGYRSGIDPVLLAASISAKPGQAVLELGCGAAPSLCCLGARVAGLTLDGLELQPGVAALARDNLASNKLTGTVWTGDIANPPAALRLRDYHHVLANPPYFVPSNGVAAAHPDRQMALANDTDLAEWVACAAKRVRPKGTVTFIQRIERLPELISVFERHLGALELVPLAPRDGAAARLFLLRARKGGRSPFRLHPAQVLHKGQTHPGDYDHYTPTIHAVLRQAQSLTFG